MQEAVVEVQDDPDDLRASLEAEFAKAEAAPIETAETAPVTGEPVAKEQPDPAADGRARGPDGKFIAKTEVAPEKAAPVKIEITAPEDATKAPVVAPSTAQDGPPVSWAAEAKAVWSTLPPAIQTAVLKREREAGEGIRQYSEKTRHLEGILAPIAAEAQRHGIDVARGVNALMTAHHKLNQNAPQAIAELAQQYGVDLGTLAGREPVPGSSAETRPQPPPAPFHDPRIDHVVSWIQSQETRQQHTVQTSVEQFAASPGHEHFDAVADDIMALIPRVQAVSPQQSHEKILQEAYDRAVWANPTTRDLVIKNQQAEAEAKRIADAKARADQARRAGSSVTGAPSGQPAPTSRDSLREEIEAAFAPG